MPVDTNLASSPHDFDRCHTGARPFNPMDLARLPVPADDQEEPFVPDLSEGPERGLYLALLELLDEGLVITSDEVILEVNSAACRHLERSYGELVGQPLASLFPSEQAFLAARGRMFIHGQMRGKLQIALPGERHKDMRFVAAARLQPGIHALILAPDELAEPGSAGVPAAADALWPRLAAVLEQPVLVVDGEGRTAAANAAALRRLGVARGDLVGRPLKERLAVRWPAAQGESLVKLRPHGGEEWVARLLPGPKPGWRLLILPGASETAVPGLPAPRPAGANRPSSPEPQPGIRTGDLAQRALAANLAQAISRHELEVHFAPEWRHGAPLPAAEALLRWRHPELGLIPCGHLMPVLREAGLLADFGAWILGEACARAANWAAQGRPVPVVVNVSLEQVGDPAFPALVRAILKESGLAPEALELDLEESLLAQGESAQTAVLEELAGLGVGLAIDNFGQGLSSIARLGRLPLTRLRLDPALVREGLAAAPALKATLAMARALALEVGAKGVDNGPARERLIAMGCTALQGRHIGPPMSPADFARQHLGLPL